MATTVVKATEQVLVESATAVVSSLGKVAAAEFKTIESGVAQEVVSATDDDVSNIIDKVEGAAETVFEEVVNGAEHVVEAVKQHPELIAEGALAVAIGVASLVQPELMVGGVALVGKMAADSAKKTVTEIASTEGEKVVKAISKNLADDAKIEAEKDKVQAQEKRIAEGGEVAVVEETSKTTAVTEAKTIDDGGKVAVVEATSKTTAVTEAKTIADGGDKTIAIEVQKPTATSDTEGVSGSPVKDAGPTELKITIGADGQIKAVSQSAAVEPKPAEKAVAPAVAENTENTAPAVQATDAPVKESATLAKGDPTVAGPKESTPAKGSIATAVKDVLTQSLPEAQVSKSDQSSIPASVSKKISIPITPETIPATQSVSNSESAAIQSVPKSFGTETGTTAVNSVTETTPKAAVEVTKPAEPVVVASTDATEETKKPQILAELGIIHGDAIEQSVKNVEGGSEEKSAALVPGEIEETFVQQLLHRSNSKEPVVPVEEAIGEDSLKKQQGSVESVPEPMQESAQVVNTVVGPESEAKSGSTPPIEAILPKEAVVLGEVKSQAESKLPTATEPIVGANPEKPEASSDAEEPASSSLVSQAKELAVAAVQDSPAETGPTLVTTAATVTNVTKTTTTKTVEVPSSPDVKMVTISQESLDNLHLKLDTMHEAIQSITRTLALHLPAPPPSTSLVAKDVAIQEAPAPIAPETTEPAAQEQTIPNTVQPTTSVTVDEVTPVKATTSSAESPTLPETSPALPKSTVPKRPTHAKRGSVIGSIGKFLWPFGGAPTPVKDTTPQVSTAEVTDEVEVQRPSSQTIASGLVSTKAVSTVEVTQALATPSAT